ncbi:alpha-mannosidase [candidate division KSB1 bacterium]|nr:alpha-mannosidase [candidate division KSB1 bacterium]
MIDKERQLYEARIEVFLERLKTYYYQHELPLIAEFCPFDPPIPFSQRRKGAYRPIRVGEKWGDAWQVAWFHISGQVPAGWKGKRVIARLNLGGEGCIFDSDGVPVQGLSWHSLWLPEFKRDRYLIAEKAKGGEKIDLWIEATASQIFGLRLLRDPAQDDAKRHGHFEAVVQDLTLAVFRQDIWQLYLDCFVLHNLMKSLPERSVRRARILYTLNRMIDQFQPDETAVSTARTMLKEVLVQKSNASSLRAVAVGHAHLDTGWLWPVSETVRKCARTFSTQIALMEQYPDYIFGASQAQHYAFVKQVYPGLYKKIGEKIKSGRWEIQGGMWVEPDCNLISGESMVRQILHGKRFFREEFGVEVRNLWLPDVFGYSAAMPQILKKSGLDSMVTQKISWNQFNRFPHHSFIWQGIDGSEIVVHFPPEDTYNSELLPSGLVHAQENFEERDRLNEFLVLYGMGDGGGGPTEEMIESGLRQRDLEGSPCIHFEAAQKMLDRLGRKKHLMHRWQGELYLEIHRGTLTTQAFIKKMNRYCENRLREVEFLYSLLPFKIYPYDELDELWKTVLLNQFHDILPGSSLKIVYDTTRKQYEQVLTRLAELSQKAGQKLLRSEENSLTLINTLSCDYNRPIVLPDDWRGCKVYDKNDALLPVQESEGKSAVLVDIPPMSAIVLKKGRKQKPTAESLPEQPVLENNWIRYEFAVDGTLKRIYDKHAQRQVLTPKGRGNLLRLYEDRPVNWDAWDIDIFYENQLLQQAELIEWKWLSRGDVVGVLYLKYAVGASQIEQRVYLPANSKRLDFATRVSWRERHHMLRVGFEVDIHSPEAGYEIQYGTIKRPTHRNTSWDKARFEVVGHRFADLSEQDYGVALLNDCKYGYKIHENLIELNLLRSPSSPDPEADQGEHIFTYSLLPHVGALEDSDVYAEAAQLNQPPLIYPDMAGEVTYPVRLLDDHVVLSALKKAEDEKAWIIRLYEPRGRRVKTRLRIMTPDVQLFETDLLEKGERTLRTKHRRLELSFNAFEIKTIKMVPA